MAGSQKDRPVDPDIEDTTTFAEGPVDEGIFSVVNRNTNGLLYTMHVDGIPVTDLDDAQIFLAIEELARFMSKPLKLHEPKPVEEEMFQYTGAPSLRPHWIEDATEKGEEYTLAMQQTDFAHLCLDYVLKRDMPEAIVNVEAVAKRVGAIIRIAGCF